jgi:hypothetical protein
MSNSIKWGYGGTYRARFKSMVVWVKSYLSYSHIFEDQWLRFVEAQGRAEVPLEVPLEVPGRCIKWAKRYCESGSLNATTAGGTGQRYRGIHACI